MIGFISQTPTSLSVTVEQETAAFGCQNPTADIIGWRVNGTALRSNRPPNITTASIQLPGCDTRDTLTILRLYLSITKPKLSVQQCSIKHVQHSGQTLSHCKYKVC